MERKERILWIAAVAALLALEFVRPRVEGTAWAPLTTILSRLIGAAFFLHLIRRAGYRVFRPEFTRKSAPVLILALLVAVNNAPILGLLSGRAAVHSKLWEWLLFILECAAVGCFEELAFRGYVLPWILRRLKHKPHAALLSAAASSAVFALLHLVNLFSGSAPGAVLLQVGYSFLIGGMCAAVLIATRSVFLCAAVHFIYNLGGTLLSRLGEGNQWDPITVTVTVILGLLTAVVMLLTLYRSDRSAEHLLPNP